MFSRLDALGVPCRAADWWLDCRAGGRPSHATSSAPVRQAGSSPAKLTDHFHHIAESPRELISQDEEARVQGVWRGTTQLATINKRLQLYDLVPRHQRTSRGQRPTTVFSP